MTQVSINRKRIQNNLNNQMTINELMNLILDNFAQKEEIITQISVNGEKVHAQDENELMEVSLESINDIDFTLKSSLDFAFEALDSCSSYIEVVTAKIYRLIEFYNQNKTDSANELFAEIIEIIDLFVQLISRINRTIRVHMGKQYSKSKTIQELEIHLLSVLKALVPAKEKGDIIMLCDLLEYELIDNLTQWKIKAIPELKKIRNS